MVSAMIPASTDILAGGRRGAPRPYARVQLVQSESRLRGAQRWGACGLLFPRSLG